LAGIWWDIETIDNTSKTVDRMKWPKRLIIVRHGESEHNLAVDLFDEGSDELLRKQYDVRDMDIPLTKKGVYQAKETGKYLAKKERFDICFCSPYKRTLQTAQNITDQFDYDINIYLDNRLREKEFGKLHGLSKEQIKEKYPEEYHDRERDGKYWYRLPRGENYPDVEARIHNFLDKLVRDWAGKKVLIVTHQVCCKLFRALFEHLGEEEVLALEDIDNCGIQSYSIDTSKVKEGRLKIEEFNKVVY
jgi:broad specificity phosphatase PhoE